MKRAPRGNPKPKARPVRYDWGPRKIPREVDGQRHLAERWPVFPKPRKKWR